MQRFQGRFAGFARQLSAPLVSFRNMGQINALSGILATDNGL